MAAIITDTETREKFGISDTKIVPQLVVFKPELTLVLPLIAERAVAEANPSYPVPRIMKRLNVRTFSLSFDHELSVIEVPVVRYGIHTRLEKEDTQ